MWSIKICVFDLMISICFFYFAPNTISTDCFFPNIPNLPAYFIWFRTIRFFNIKIQLLIMP